MPYYVYKISTTEGIDLVKRLELLATHEVYRDAKREAKQLRVDSAESDAIYKIMFADNELAAEEQLLEKREKPVLMEHER